MQLCFISLHLFLHCKIKADDKDFFSYTAEEGQKKSAMVAQKCTKHEYSAVAYPRL